MKEYSPGGFLLWTWTPCTQCQGITFSIYPFVPWLTPLLWGLIFGKLFLELKSDRIRIGINVIAGCLLICSFFVLRLGQGFGNIHLQLLEPPVTESVYSFFNLTKYPPSLAYLCWTMVFL